MSEYRSNQSGLAGVEGVKSFRGTVGPGDGHISESVVAMEEEVRAFQQFSSDPVVVDKEASSVDKEEKPGPEDIKREKHPGLSRRKFLQAAAAAGVALSIMGGKQAEAQEAYRRMTPKIRFFFKGQGDGQVRELLVEQNTLTKGDMIVNQQLIRQLYESDLENVPMDRTNPELSVDFTVEFGSETSATDYLADERSRQAFKKITDTVKRYGRLVAIFGWLIPKGGRVVAETAQDVVWQIQRSEDYQAYEIVYERMRKAMLNGDATVRHWDITAEMTFKDTAGKQVRGQAVMPVDIMQYNRTDGTQEFRLLAGGDYDPTDSRPHLAFNPKTQDYEMVKPVLQQQKDKKGTVIGTEYVLPAGYVPATAPMLMLMGKERWFKVLLPRTLQNAAVPEKFVQKE